MGPIQLVSFSEILEWPELLAEYAAECSIPEIGEIKPAKGIYAHLEASGLYQCFGYFDADKLIGFASLLTTIYPHYSKKVATLESLFVSAEYRKSGAGTALMAAVEAYAKEAGCKAILYSAPAGGKLAQVLSKRKGVRETNQVFCQVLAGEINAND